MSHYINIYYYFDDKQEVSKDRVKSFFNLISETGWYYDSHDIRGVFTGETDWSFDVPFEEALEIISDQSYVALKLGDGDIEGHVSFTDDSISLNFDSVHFRDNEEFERDGNENSRKILELIEHLCKELDFKWMRGGNEYDLSPYDEDFEPKNTILWVNYIPNVSVEDLDLSEAYKAKNIDEDLFIATRLNPAKGRRKIKEIEDMKEKIIANIQSN